MNRKHSNYPCALIWKFPLAYISEYATEALVHGHSNPSIKSSVWLPFESSRLTQGLGLAAWSHFRLISHDKRAVIIIRKKTVEKLRGHYGFFGKAPDVTPRPSWQTCYVVDITLMREKLNVSFREPEFIIQTNRSRNVLTLFHQVHDLFSNLGTVCKNLAVKHRQNLIRLIPFSSLQLTKPIMSVFSHKLQDLLFKRIGVFFLYG